MHSFSFCSWSAASRFCCLHFPTWWTNCVLHEPFIPWVDFFHGIWSQQLGGKVRHHLFCLYLGYIWNETITREINTALHLWVITPFSLVNFERNHWLIPLSPCLFVGVTIIPHRKNLEKKQNWGVSEYGSCFVRAALFRVYFRPSCWGCAVGPTDSQWSHHMVQKIGWETSEVTLCLKEIPRNNLQFSLWDLAQRRMVCRNKAEVCCACFLKPQQGVAWILVCLVCSCPC